MSTIKDQLIEEWQIDYEFFDKTIHRIVDDGFASLLPRPKRLHISNIPFSYSEHDLKILFRIFGDVLHTEIITNNRGSKGFGFVTMRTCDEAQQACDVLDKSLIGGRIVDVNLATPRKFPPKLMLAPSSSNSCSYVSPNSPLTPNTTNLRYYRVRNSYQQSPLTPTSATPPFKVQQNVFRFPPS